MKREEHFDIVYSEETIGRRVKELGEEISRDYGDRVPILLSILKGSVIFLADLMRTLTVPVNVDFMSITSFEKEGRPGGVVRILKDLDLSVSGRDIVIVEDIIDTGLTAGYLVSTLEARKPGSLAICALLDRRVRRLVDLPLRYVGFDVPDDYLVGYGLDHRERYRNLPFLARLPGEGKNP